MIYNVFWVKVAKQDIPACLEAAGFDVLFKYQDAQNLYDIDDSYNHSKCDTSIGLAGGVFFEDEMMIWFDVQYIIGGHHASRVSALGRGLSMRFSVPVYYGDIDFGDNEKELNPPVFHTHRKYQAVHLDRPRIAVDFNETCGNDLYLLSQEDDVIDTSGQVVRLKEGLHVFLYDDDEDENGHYDPIFADAVVEKNCLAKYPHVKWLARMLTTDNPDSERNGFYYRLSDIEI